MSNRILSGEFGMDYAKSFYVYSIRQRTRDSALILAGVFGAPLIAGMALETGAVGGIMTGYRYTSALSNEIGISVGELGNNVINIAKRRGISYLSKNVARPLVRKLSFRQKRWIVNRGYRNQVVEFYNKQHLLVNTKNIHNVIPSSARGYQFLLR